MLTAFLSIIVTLTIVGALSVLVGKFIVRVMEGKRTFLHPVLLPVEKLFYRLCGIDETVEQGWKTYAAGVLVLTVVSTVFTYLILRFQGILPLNPGKLPGVSPALAFNTAISYATNTNWQNYGGEAVMSYFSQMVALVFQNFFSAAAGIAIALALIRGLTRRSSATIGNFYVDMVRCVLYILLPASFIFALVLISQGAIQTLVGSHLVHTLLGGTQAIAQGPIASQEAIKNLGTNGGGFLNANAATTWENPNGLTNVLEIFAFLIIPFSLCFTFGKMANNMRQGVAVFAAMMIVLVGGIGLQAWAEQSGNPFITHQMPSVSQASTSTQAGGNMEGKEVRFGPISSAFYDSAATATSTGSVNGSQDSYTPLGGLVSMVFMELGEITPGGAGSGMYGILVFAIIAVFLAGLMVGRTPEYVGKKIEGREIKLAALAILILPFTILGFTALSVMLAPGQAGPLNTAVNSYGATVHTPHAFSEILYAFSSATGNNGSAFAGLSGNTLYYNTMLAASMWVGRIIFLIPVIALAGSMAKKKVVPASAGTFPSDTPLFTILLIGVIIIVGALTFLPSLALGPIVEHLQLITGHLGGA